MQTLPFIPTLEWLKKHDKKVEYIRVSYIATSKVLDGNLTMSITYDLIDEFSTRSLIRLSFREGKWIVLDGDDWPSWLRKF